VRTGDPAQCDAGDWTLVAPNAPTCQGLSCDGDVRLTQFDDGSLTSITMVVATASHLYVGFDGADGVAVFRTANPAAATRADFEGTGGCPADQHGDGACAGYGGAGFGDPTITRIYDAQALFGSVWITAGSASTAVELVELP
jgi:hypothetical protein